MVDADTYWAAFDSLRENNQPPPISAPSLQTPAPERLNGGCLLYRLPIGTESSLCAPAHSNRRGPQGAA